MPQMQQIPSDNQWEKRDQKQKSLKERKKKINVNEINHNNSAYDGNKLNVYVDVDVDVKNYVLYACS